jgi:predicted nucleotidyltransferase
VIATDFESLLRTLLDHDVEFILVGGVAANLHGSARATFDIDVVYRRTPDNIARLVTSLSPLEPYLRGAPPGLPFRLDHETVTAGLNFTLQTKAGELDLLGEIVGGGTYEDLLPGTIAFSLFGHTCRCVSLLQLLALKRAAGRPKDREAIAELEVLLEGLQGGR